MFISAFDLFNIGIGPSSSHTVGPMRAALDFTGALLESGRMADVSRVRVELFGSLGLTGRGHGTPKAVMLGLMGESPESVDIGSIPDRVARIYESRRLRLNGDREIRFVPETDLILHRRKRLQFHPNGMTYAAIDVDGGLLLEKTCYSIGGGFVVDEDEIGSAETSIVEPPGVLPFPFDTAAQLLEHCGNADMRISDIMLENEQVRREASGVCEGLLRIWSAMRECIANGIANDGVLPGGLKVRRRAPGLYRDLERRRETAASDPLAAMDWVTLFAVAVNEENAAGGRVVTAPTNGAAGIIPAVLNYHMEFSPDVGEDDVVRFLLVAAAIAILFKKNASISGAEVGCQGEVGVACSMAAGALTEVLGGTPEQVENAAEIGMEHNLGLTCDPIGGLVQIPCIERNAVGSVKAIHAARVALSGDGSHVVSLDRVIRTMRKTGRDMHRKYKETSRGGLAIHALDVPVNVTEC